MDKNGFDAVFDKIVVESLVGLGFIKSGKSIYFLDEEINVSLIRLGGRNAWPGGISHVLCFRHTFLPNLDMKVPGSFESQAFSYPIKIDPDSVGTFLNKEDKYYPQNLRYEKGRYDYQDKPDHQIFSELKKLKNDIISFWEWSKSITPVYLKDEILSNGEAAWIEKFWLQAYESKLVITN
ncbi:hypothetical protein OA92_01875 [Marinomonas sp. SBI22]|uniref:hypothetical protein n=1 Tax=unclassified Marinomonas TaxID=196814 RepID=UPI0007BC4EE6|nr:MULTISPECIES: hypothetical protein [unclassified Marinomonas]KZM45961.1 hypothetical protein OA92_01875 [Marinomonas sp. SBI22]KZM46479.1 hypothetical protein OA91_06020 [Marinomonas sp. SBI8L]